MTASTKPPARVELDPHPPAYETPVPSLPRAPRIPSDIDQLVRSDIKERDTDRSAPLSGEFEVSDDAEKTPHEAPFSLKNLAAKMDLAIAAANAAANESIQTRSEVASFRQELASFRTRLSAIEAERVWVPIVFSSIAIALSLFAILRHT